VYFPHSLGIFYPALTQYLGFPHHGDAYTVVGLAVLGWFQGRMEWGPRALGNRSILCDPRRGNMKAIFNAKIKRWESFRPFAPSVLAEAVGEWFEEDDAVPFMMQVFQIREEKRGANSRRPARRWLRPPADRLSPHQPALLSSNRIFPGPDRRADGAEHVVQRERAGGLPTLGSTRLLSAHQDGCVVDRRRCHGALMRDARDRHRSKRRRFWPIATAQKSMAALCTTAEGRGAAETMRCAGVSKPYQRMLIPRMPLRVTFIACYSGCPGGDQDHALYLFTSTFNRI
jgi:hypothetical protein